jgi:predicted alpha-1,2-mannosidase
MSLRIAGILFIALILQSCNDDSQPKTEAVINQPVTDLVNPFIGTGGHGHTYPGASMPFGMMQLSPDTRLDGWDGCSGYHYSDDVIYGFSHTHLSGTGVSDYGDVLLMPTDKPLINNGTNGDPGYSSHFSHEKESARPGYYQVFLEDTGIEVELTVSRRSGVHRYQYSDSLNQYLILDLEHRDQLLEHELTIESPTVISGKRFSKAWASQQMLFFYMETSHPIKDWEQYQGENPSVAAMEFENPNNEPIIIKIGISPVDVDGARSNLKEEIGDKSFLAIKEEANRAWEKELSKIIVEDDETDQLTVFYTALYHTMLAPNLYQDVDGRYRGMDLEIHQTQDFDYYTVFSLWDTYRAAHPLYTIIDQKRTNDFINTFNAKYEEGGILPIWDLSGNYTGCMIGYHAVPVIADAYMKGIRDYDVEKAFEAIKHSATRDKLGLKGYKKLGYIPVESESESVSKTLEYAYDDWTIAQMAAQLGNQEDYNYYINRAQNYKNLFNPETSFFQGRYRNIWFAPFDPYEVNFNYTEANAWQYSLYAPQDINGHMQLLGGKEAYEKHLDELFTATNETSGRNQADITGLIGQYAHGNEPSHHMAYLYNYVGKPHKTQERVHQILTELYRNAADGISGNEDCGQMSAWYVLSALGFYPVTPGSNEYAIGSPLFDKATIHLENGNNLTIVKSGDGPFIKNMSVDHPRNTYGNNRRHNHTSITHAELMQGGQWTFQMQSTPSKWGSSVRYRSRSYIDDDNFITTPYIASGDISFPEKTTVTLNNITSDSQIYYSIFHKDFELYNQPITIDQSAELKIYAQKGDIKSPVVTTQFFKYDDNRSIELNYEYANEYSAGGNDALIDGMRGSSDFRSGAWQGIKNQGLDAIVDLGEPQDIKEVSINFLKDQRSWIFYPTEVHVELLDNNMMVLQEEIIQPPETGQQEVSDIYTASLTNGATDVRYVRVTATNYGALPEWHLGYPMQGTAWIFVDEITVK